MRCTTVALALALTLAAPLLAPGQSPAPGGRAAEIRDLVARQTRGTYLRVELASGAKVEGKLVSHDDAQFYVSGSRGSRWVEYADATKVKKGRGAGYYVKRVVTAPAGLAVRFVMTPLVLVYLVVNGVPIS